MKISDNIANGVTVVIPALGVGSPAVLERAVPAAGGPNDPRIQYVRHVRTLGSCAARNTEIQQARCGLVMTGERQRHSCVGYGDLANYRFMEQIASSILVGRRGAQARHIDYLAEHTDDQHD